MEISIDDEELGFVSNGKTFFMLLELEEGEHTLTISKAGNSSKNAKKEINLKGDMTFKCNISHGGSISLKDIETTDDVKGSALVVPDLTGLILSDAEDQLKEIGFDNISDKGIGGTVWNEDNWLVAEQSIEPNTAVDKHQEIILTCQHLNDYFNETFSGKNVSEIQEIADNNWYTVSFQDENEENMNSVIESMKPEAKKEWVATKAEQYANSEKKALLTIKSTSPKKEAEVEKEKDVSDDDSNEQANNTSANQLPIMKGSSLDKALTKASEYGVTVSFDDDFGDGTCGVFMSNASGGIMMDIFYTPETEEIVCASITTNKLASSSEQQDFIKGMASVLCPSSDKEAVKSWVNSNVGKEAKKDINGFIYETSLGPVNNALYYAGSENWENWSLSQ